MKLFDIPLGLIINFNETKLIDGVAKKTSSTEAKEGNEERRGICQCV